MVQNEVYVRTKSVGGWDIPCERGERTKARRRRKSFEHISGSRGVYIYGFAGKAFVVLNTC